jgi:hypothetical protein
MIFQAMRLAAMRYVTWAAFLLVCGGEASQGCSPRITSSCPPSRPSPSGMSASDAMRRPVGMRSTDMRRAEMPPATAAAHVTNHPPTTPRDAKGQTHGPGGGGVCFCVPGVWWRDPADRVHHRARADPEDPDTLGRTARAAARVSRPRASRRLGRARAGPRRPGNLSGVARRTARHRHPQPLSGSHATVRTAREQGGFKAGLRRRDKSGLERG